MLALIRIADSESDITMAASKVPSKSEVNMAAPQVTAAVPFMLPVADGGRGDSDSSDMEWWMQEAKAEDEGSEATAEEPPPKKVTCVLTKLSVL